eukprot:9469437-Heterocapsa_arctica.AAC.1
MLQGPSEGLKGTWPIAQLSLLHKESWLVLPVRLVFPSQAFKLADAWLKFGSGLHPYDWTSKPGDAEKRN